MHLQQKYYLTFDTDMGIQIKQNSAQYPLHHITYAPEKFEAATSSSLEDAFTRKYINYLLP